jgi:hypothetical protein
MLFYTPSAFGLAAFLYLKAQSSASSVFVGTKTIFGLLGSYPKPCEQPTAAGWLRGKIAACLVPWCTSLAPPCPSVGTANPRIIFPLYIDYIIVSSFSLPLQLG